ncbi:MAG: phosphatidylglycerophosphatase A [Acidimicrobiia bacterium]
MHRLIASLFGSGLVLGRFRGSDSGSGTVGALITLALSLWLGSVWGWPAQLIAAAALTVISLWVTSALAPTTGDAGWIVIDEAAGTMVATIGLIGWPAAIAFVAFRVADITKTPFPGVSPAERLPGGVGITADDLVAGIYGLLIGLLAKAIFF